MKKLKYLQRKGRFTCNIEAHQHLHKTHKICSNQE